MLQLKQNIVKIGSAHVHARFQNLFLELNLVRKPHAPFLSILDFVAFVLHEMKSHHAHGSRARLLSRWHENGFLMHCSFATCTLLYMAQTAKVMQHPSERWLSS